MTREEARQLLREVTDIRAQMRGLLREIRKRQSKLVRVAVDAFNEASEPLDGMVVAARNVTIGFRPCVESPIGVCVYSERVVPIPGQKALDAQREQGKSVLENYPDCARTDACLFCGTVLADDFDGSDGRQLIPK